MAGKRSSAIPISPVSVGYLFSNLFKVLFVMVLEGN